MPLTVNVVTYAKFPLLWCGKLQVENNLSTTEVEYIVLIQAMHNLIHFMALMK